MNSVENFGNGSKYQIKFMEVSDIREESPFKDLFEIKSDTLDAIENHMSEYGYDGSQPIIVWKEKGIVIDGHTRLKAVKNLQDFRSRWPELRKEYDFTLEGKVKYQKLKPALTIFTPRMDQENFGMLLTTP